MNMEDFLSRLSSSPAVFDLDQAIVTAYNSGYNATLDRADLDLTELKKSVSEIQYSNVTSRRIPREFDAFVHVNNSDVEDTQTWNQSRTSTESVTWTTQETVKTSISGSFEIPIPKIGDLTIGGTVEQTFEDTTARTKCRERTWSWQVVIPIPARSRIDAKLFLNEASVTAPFNGDIIVSGEILAILELSWGITTKTGSYGRGVYSNTEPPSSRARRTNYSLSDCRAV
jgi:hypothetical protein